MTYDVVAAVVVQDVKVVGLQRRLALQVLFGVAEYETGAKWRVWRWRPHNVVAFVPLKENMLPD